MDFLLNNIWAIGAVLLVLWIINKVLTGKTRRIGSGGAGDHFRDEIVLNEKIHDIERGNFTDEDLKLLLPIHKVLAITLVRKKYGMNLVETTSYVEKIQNNN